MSKTVHSVKLIPYDAVDLNRLSYTNGDIVFDNTNTTLRLMNGHTQGGTFLATQTWVTGQLSSYATSASLTTLLNSYATTASVTAAVSTEATARQTAITTALSSYVTSSSLTTTLSSYALSSAIPTVPTYTVTTASASGAGSLTLVGTTFTFTPPSLTGYATTTALTAETTRATTAEALLAPKANPAFTGTVTINGQNFRAVSMAIAAALQ